MQEVQTLRKCTHHTRTDTICFRENRYVPAPRHRSDARREGDDGWIKEWKITMDQQKQEGYDITEKVVRVLTQGPEW